MGLPDMSEVTEHMILDNFKENMNKKENAEEIENSDFENYQTSSSEDEDDEDSNNQNCVFSPIGDLQIVE
jgi:hypothetical protein